MKNIAIPLLLAGSAKAEAKKKAAMLQDYEVPEPILIASSWTGDVCVDAAGAVAQALSDLSASQGELEELEEGLEELEEAQDEAIEARMEAVAAVSDLDEEMDAAVESNNGAIAALIGLKDTWNQANVAASIGEALVASRLSAKNAAQDDYDEAVIDYAGFTPSEEEEEEGEEAVAGLLSVTEGVFGQLEDAEATESGEVSTAGSTSDRNAKHIDYASKNCSASADSGAAGAGLVVECGGSFQNAESYDYSSFSQSLAAYESSADDKAELQETARLTEAAKNLLTVEHRQIFFYVEWARSNAQTDRTADCALTSTDYSSCISAEDQDEVRSQANIIAGFQAGNDDLTLEQIPTSADRDSAVTNWLLAMRLVYGRVAGVQANDGNGNDVNSQEYDMAETGATGAADWSADATTSVQALKAYLDDYNANRGAEIGTDGYESAYTELKGGTAEEIEAGNSFTGKCTEGSATKSAPTMVENLAELGGYDTSGTAELGWESGESTDAGIWYDGGEATSYGVNSTCAMLCSVELDYLHDSETNLPTSTGSWGTGECLGFEADITNAAAPVCTSYSSALPTENTDGTADSTTEQCFVRNLSSLANAYVTGIAGVGLVATEEANTDFDYMEVALTNWDTAYKAFIDARAELDIVSYYKDQIQDAGDDTTLDADAEYGVVGLSNQYQWVDGDSETGAYFEYIDAQTAYTNASTDYTDAAALYSARAVQIATSESDYLLAQAQWEENNALISKLTVLHEIATAASGAALGTEESMADALEEATTDWQDAVDAYDGVEATEEVEGSTGLVEAQTAAEGAYDDAWEAIYGEEGSDTALGEYEDGGAGDLGTLFGLRAAALEAYEDLEAAMGGLGELNGEIAIAQGDVEEAMADHLAAIVACKVENYDAYTETLQLAVQSREDDLDDILALVTEAEEDAPAAGAAGSRCEKALSNGTFRPTRGETTCNEGLCCGAARVAMGDVMMTIETCQAVDTTTYSYVAARAPMATEAPAAETLDFVCIEGAKKLAAAASALATAVYMLA